MPSGTAGSNRETQTKPSQKDAQTASNVNAEKPVKRSEFIPPASSQVRPESGRMVQLPKTAAASQQDGCRCGTYRNWPLGRIAQEKDGIETLEWLAHDYRGKDETMRQGARILLQAAMAA